MVLFRRTVYIQCVRCNERKAAAAGGCNIIAVSAETQYCIIYHDYSQTYISLRCVYMRRFIKSATRFSSPKAKDLNDFNIIH